VILGNKRHGDDRWVVLDVVVKTVCGLVEF